MLSVISSVPTNLLHRADSYQASPALTKQGFAVREGDQRPAASCTDQNHFITGTPTARRASLCSLRPPVLSGRWEKDSQQQQELLFRGSAPYGSQTLGSIWGASPQQPPSRPALTGEHVRGEGHSKSKCLLLSPPRPGETTNARRLAAIKRACLPN